MKKFSLLLLAFTLSTGLVGCGSEGNTTVSEGVDESAVEEYERLRAQESAGMEDVQQ